MGACSIPCDLSPEYGEQDVDRGCDDVTQTNGHQMGHRDIELSERMEAGSWSFAGELGFDQRQGVDESVKQKIHVGPVDNARKKWQYGVDRAEVA